MVFWSCWFAHFSPAKWFLQQIGIFEVPCSQKPGHDVHCPAANNTSFHFHTFSRFIPDLYSIFFLQHIHCRPLQQRPQTDTIKQERQQYTPFWHINQPEYNPWDNLSGYQLVKQSGPVSTGQI